MANRTGVNEWDIPLEGDVYLTYEQLYYQGDTELSEFLEENGVYELQVITKDGGRRKSISVVSATKLGTFSAAVPGDVNGDGEVTSYDITALYSFILSGDTSSIVNGDQNGDGEITSADVTFVYSIILGSKKVTLE